MDTKTAPASARYSRGPTFKAENEAYSLLARVERSPSRTLFDELAKVDPSQRARYRVLQTMQSQLRVELHSACDGPREGLQERVDSFSRRIKAIERAECRAMIDTYFQDHGGQG